MKTSRIWVLLLVGVLAGCSTTQERVGGRLVLPANVPPDDGIVLVKLIGLQSLSAFNAKWKTLRLIDPQGRMQEIQDTAPASASYSLFLGTVPKGQYRFAELESLGPAAGSFGVLPALAMAIATGSTVKEFPQFSGFTVAPGTVSNLGTIVFAFPQDGKGPPLSTAVLDDEAGRRAAMGDVDSVSQPRMANLPQSGWEKPSDAGSNAAALALIRKNTGRLSPLEAARDGRVTAGGPLGLIHVRRTDGTWEHVSIGALDTITYARALDDGRIVAGTDNGRYYLGRPGQPTWQRFDLPDRDTSVMRIEPLGDTGYAIQVALTTGRFGRTAWLFKPKLEEAGGEKALIEFDGFSAVGRSPAFFDGQELRIYFNHPGITRTADVHRIDPRTGEKKKDEVSYWVKDVYRLPDGTVVMERMSGLLSTYPMFSKDNGRTFSNIDIESPGIVRFIDERTGYGFKMAAMGWSTTTLGMNRTQDGGKTWEPVGTPIVASGQTRMVATGPKELVVYTGQQIVSTRDEGATWRVEWPQP